MEEKSLIKIMRSAEKREQEYFIPEYDHIFDESSRKNKQSSFGILKGILKLNAKLQIMSCIVYVIQALAVWIVPLFTAHIINLVTEALNTPQGVTDEIWMEIGICALIMAVLIIENIPTTIWRNTFTSRMRRNTSAGIRCSVVRKLQTLSLTYHNDMRTGKIQSKFLRDIEAVDGLLSNIDYVIILFISAVISIGISIYKNGIVSLFFLVVIPIKIMATMFFTKKMKKNNRDYRIRTEDVSTKMTTMMEMLPVTKSHGLENTEIREFDGSVERLTASGKEVDKTIAKFGSCMWVISTLLNSSCVLFCVVLAIYGYIGVGDIILFQTLFSQITAHVSTIVNSAPQLTAGMESLSSISELMNVTDVEINVGKKAYKKIDGDVEFSNVWYKYPKAKDYAVKDFSLNVKAGECIAVVGASGSGKSTLMNMIIGFMFAEKGCIKIDGKNINGMDLTEYRKNISVVPQSSILFAGSIKDNITYGLKHYTEEQLNSVVEMANIMEFVKELPNGLDSDVGEHGSKLSGGQRQRITIARALIRDPKILILDEATSALDNLSEFHVQKAISESIKGRTTFIVAHRLSTIRNADRIVVMEEGKMVEIGTYSELMEKKGKFFELKNLNELDISKIENL